MHYILIILLCWAISFLFNGIEAGLVAINPARLRHQVKERKRDAIKLHRLLQKPERLLATVLLITNLANILALLLLTRALFLSFGVRGFLYSILIALPIYLFVLSLLPKSLFRRFPLRALARLAGLLELTSILLWPLLELGGRSGRLFVPAGGVQIFAAREELKQLAAQSEREGSLTATERAMIDNVVDFRNIRTRDVMIPRANVISVQPETLIEAALALSASSGVDRLPVMNSSGEPIGLVNAIDILLDQSGATSLSKYTRRIVFARENEPAYFVIQRLRAARLGLAAIIDQKSRFVGIATSEDLIRRLVRSS